MLSNKKLFLFDIDGTVCQGERLIDGTMQFLEDIRQSGGQFVFITNNSTKSIQDYILKFQKLGIKTDYSNFITASTCIGLITSGGEYFATLFKEKL